MCPNAGSSTAQTNAWQADYLYREAQTIFEMIQEYMTTGDIAKYDETKL